MALDPSIILQAGNFQKLDPGQILETRAQVGLRNQQIAQQQQDRALAQQKMQRLGDIGRQAAGGDLTGAKAAAVAAGDFDLVKAIQGLEQEHRDTLKRRVDSAAPLAYEASKLPYEQRKAFIGANSQGLIANGWSPDELAGFDPTDQALHGIVTEAQSLKDIFDREDKAAELAQRERDNAAGREERRGNAYISAGLLPPDSTGGGDIVSRMLPITFASESGGNPNAVSPKGARGRMQVMPGTNVDPGFGVRPPADDSEAERARVGQDYLAAMMDRYGNDPAKAWAAYNAGPGRVDAALARGKGNWLAMLPKETRDYVKSNVQALGSGGATPASGLQVIPGGKLDKPKAQRMTPAEVAAEGLDPKLTYYRGADGVPQAVSGQNNRTSLKPPPAVAMTAYTGNRTSIGKIDQALKAIDAYPDATGFLIGNAPNAISSRTDPKGVDARAKIADIGSLLIHDRSGAAVTASETPRLLPFIPQVSDDAATVRTKLRNLRAALQSTNSDIEDVYSEEQGFKFPTFGSRPDAKTLTPKASAPVRVQTVEQARALPPGTVFITPDGRKKVR